MRIVTLNVWHDAPPLQQRLNAIKQELIALNPDVVLLQEVSPLSVVPQIANPLGMLFTRIGKSRPDATEGVAILSRMPLLNSRSMSLPAAENPTWDRVLLTADVILDGEAIKLATTHLNYAANDVDSRTAQIQTIIKALAGDSKPVVLGGDFNAVPEAPEIALLRKAGFIDVGPSSPTWAARNPGVPPQAAKLRLATDRKIDYLFIRGLQTQTGRIGLDRPIDGVYPSDHFAVVADISPSTLTTTSTTDKNDNKAVWISIATIGILGVLGIGIWQLSRRSAAKAVY